MENLTDKVSSVSIESKIEVKTSSYAGLRLIEAANYEGPTSIMYWM